MFKGVTEKQLVLPPDPIELQGELAEGKWIGDKELTIKLLRDITSLLVGYDTNGKDGKDFAIIQNTFEVLLEPLRNFINLTSNKEDHPFIIISPKMPEAEEIIRIGSEHEELRTQMINKGQFIKIHKVLLNCHFDTVKEAGIYASYQAFQDLNNPDILYGRGTNDMKGQVAVVILLLYLFADRGIDNFFICFSSNEEYNIFKDQCYYKIMQGMLLNIDMEATGRHFGYFANEITPSQDFDFIFRTSEKQYLQKEVELAEGIIRVMEMHDYNIGKDVDFNIVRKEIGIRLSFAYSDGFVFIDKDDIKKEIKELISKLFSVDVDDVAV